jgi:hypothetical protein
MKITIIPVDGSVGKDGKFYNDINLDSCNIPANIHALQWDGVSGWIEFKDTAPNEEITVLPEWVNCCIIKWEQIDNTPKPDPVPPTAEQNKQTAIKKLKETDWAIVADVTDPSKSNPYLSNVQDFIAYRNSVRQYAIYPVSGNIAWDATPQEVWTKV